MTTKRKILCVTLMVVFSGAIMGGCREREREMVTTYEASTHNLLSQLRVFIEHSLPPQPPPIGDIGALEQWLNDLCENDDGSRDIVRHVYMVGSAAIVRTSGDGRLRLVDAWGHPLVYRCPSGMPGRMFRLYSIGPNGIDEDGAGDDIEPAVKPVSVR